MVKSIVSIACVASIILGVSIFERLFVTNSFKDFSAVIESVYDKVENQTAVEADVYALQKNWLEKKKSLHIFIPHTDIREVDLWLTETVKLVGEEKWQDAKSKLEVLLELAEQIPKYFTPNLSNIF